MLISKCKILQSINNLQLQKRFFSNCGLIITIGIVITRFSNSWYNTYHYNVSSRTCTSDLAGELWGLYYKGFGENWPRYNGTVLYLPNFPAGNCIKSCSCHTPQVHIDGLVQDCNNSSALAMGLLQSCTKSPISESCNTGVIRVPKQKSIKLKRSDFVMIW